MARTISHMIAVKKAIGKYLENEPGVVEVRSALSPGGPEVQVIVVRGHEKRLRVKVPREKIGVPIAIRVQDS